MDRPPDTNSLLESALPRGAKWGANSIETTEDNMNFVKICLAVLAGFVLGATFYRPQTVKATNGINVKSVKEGYNGYILGSQVVGFACTQDTCYIATQ